MIALWLPFAVAGEPVTSPPTPPEPEPAALRTLHPEDPLHQRLLGDVPANVTAPLPSAGLGSWLGLFGILAAGSGLAWAARKRHSLFELQTDNVLRIVGRSGFGMSQLVVIDICDRSGRTRRLLIGTGSSSPALVADLGDDEHSLDSAESSSSAPASESETEFAVTPSFAAPPDPPPQAAIPPKRPAAAARTFTVNVPGLLPPPVDPAERAQRKRAAMALIDEVSRERRTSSGPGRL